MSLEAWGDEGDICPEGYVTEEAYDESIAEKDAEIKRLRRNLERTLALVVAKIAGSLHRYSSVEETLILNDAKDIIAEARAALSPKTTRPT